MRAGLPLALCTDNPAISRTTLIGEFLALLRQSFVHVFLPSAKREALLMRVNGKIFDKMSLTLKI